MKLTSIINTFLEHLTQNHTYFLRVYSAYFMGYILAHHFNIDFSLLETLGLVCSISIMFLSPRLEINFQINHTDVAQVKS